MEPYKIILVDDHSLFRNGLRGLLERCAECRVVGEAASGEEFLAMLGGVDADVVFMDFAMPGLDGAQTTERALAQRPDLKIITLSMFGEESYYSRMVEAGARGFLLKDSDIGDVIDAIETVTGGGSYFSPQLLTSLTGRMRTREDAADEQLSSREREILVAVCRGLSNQEIADELFISKRTVDKHRANILEKTGCKNTASLVVYAIRNGIVDISGSILCGNFRTSLTRGERDVRRYYPSAPRLTMHKTCRSKITPPLRLLGGITAAARTPASATPPSGAAAGG